MAVTIKELSARCGLSVSTVSKALNDYPDVSEDVYKRQEHAQHDIYRANRDELIAKPLVSILKRELLKKHVIDERMFKGNRPIGQRLIQMPFRRRIARRAPVLDAQQGKRRFAVFPNAAALPVNPFQHSACNVQRVRPIRLLRQVVCRQFRACLLYTSRCV